MLNSTQETLKKLTLKKIIFEQVMQSHDKFSHLHNQIQQEIPYSGVKQQYERFKHKSPIYTQLTDEQSKQTIQPHDLSHYDLSGLDFQHWDMRQYNIQHCDLRGCNFTKTKLNRDSLFGCTLNEAALETLLFQLEHYIVSFEGVNVIGPLKKDLFLKIKHSYLGSSYHGCGFDATALQSLSKADVTINYNDYIRIIGNWSKPEHRTLFLKLFTSQSDDNSIQCVKIDANILKSLFCVIYNKSFSQVDLIGNFQRYIDPKNNTLKFECDGEIYTNFGNNTLWRTLKLNQDSANTLLPLLKNPRPYGINNIYLLGKIDNLDFNSIDKKYLQFIPQNYAFTKNALAAAIDYINEYGKNISPIMLTGDLNGFDFSKISTEDDILFEFDNASMDATTFESFIPHQINRQKNHIETALQQGISSLTKQTFAENILLYGDFSNIHLENIDLELFSFAENVIFNKDTYLQKCSPFTL